MSRYYSYLHSAERILSLYEGREPFAVFLKSFFSREKKYGSRDRREVAHLCYCYFRLGHAASQLPAGQRILLGYFLCTPYDNGILSELASEWNERVGDELEKKLEMISPLFQSADIFPWKTELSGKVDAPAFALSFLRQPDLFIRIRPGYEKVVREKLTGAAVPFCEIGPSSMALPNTTRASELLLLDKEAVVQDISSQRVGDFLQPLLDDPKHTIGNVWDCCAASGGKSIMLYDRDPSLSITVSDVRPSIMANLHKRFDKAGITHYTSFIADLTRDDPAWQPGPFDLVIADVPCSGSGTWSRTPEQLYYFSLEKIGLYTRMQRRIVGHAVSQLRPGGILLYVTCSVFREENEDAIQFFQDEYGMELLSRDLLTGYEERADTLFAALLQRPLTL